MRNLQLNTIRCAKILLFVLSQNNIEMMLQQAKIMQQNSCNFRFFSGEELSYTISNRKNFYGLVLIRKFLFIIFKIYILYGGRFLGVSVTYLEEINYYLFS